MEIYSRTNIPQPEIKLLWGTYFANSDESYIDILRQWRIEKFKTVRKSQYDGDPYINTWLPQLHRNERGGNWEFHLNKIKSYIQSIRRYDCSINYSYSICLNISNDCWYTTNKWDLLVNITSTSKRSPFISIYWLKLFSNLFSHSFSL